MRKRGSCSSSSRSASRSTKSSTGSAKVEAAKPVSVPTMPGDIEIPVTGVRKAIAANMLRSKHEAPHAWMMIEVDVTNLVSYRNSIKGDFKSVKALT